jgi:hypothetical protein
MPLLWIGDAHVDTDIVNLKRSAANAAVPAGFASFLVADRLIGNVGRNTNAELPGTLDQRRH